MRATICILGLVVYLSTEALAAGDFSDTKISPAKGKQGQTFTIAFSSANCMKQPDTKKENLREATATVPGGDADLTLEKPTSGEDCIRQGNLKLHDDASPGEVQVIFKPTPVAPAFLISFTIQDKNAGAIPPGLKPTVDLEWDVLDHSITRDNFGKRVADNFYAIQVVIGNDSGYALQLASVGFIPRSVSALAFAQQVLPNSSYVIARGVLEEGQLVSARNTADRYLQGTAILLAGFTPFFKNIGHRSTYTAAVAVFGNPLLQSFERILPDKTITELKRLDDFTLRDGMVVANNTHVRTIVFFQKYLVRGMVALTQQQLKTGLQDGPGNLKSLGAILDELQKKSQSDTMKSMAREAQEAAQVAATSDVEAARGLQAKLDGLLRTLRAENTKLSSTDVLELQIGNLRLLRFINANVKNVDNLLEPLIIRWELSRIVLVGDEIAYINRIRIDSAAPTIGVPAPLVVDESTDPNEIPPGVKTPITITGEHLAGAAVTAKDTTGYIQIEKGTTDINGKFLTIAVTVDTKYEADKFGLIISSPGIGGPAIVSVGVADVPVVRKITPDTLPKSGGEVKVEGKKLTDVKAYLDDSKDALEATPVDANSFTIKIKPLSANEVTLNFKTTDGKSVPAAQKLKVGN